MKNITAIIITFFFVSLSFAQTPPNYKNDLMIIEVTNDLNVHFRSPEPVQFVDLSTDRITGDIPIENVVRIKIQSLEERKTVLNDSITTVEDLYIPYQDREEIGIVTIVGQSFMAQYRIVYRDKVYATNVIANIEITPDRMQSLEFPTYELSNSELKVICMDIIKTKKLRKPKRKEKKLKMVSALNNIYTVGDYVFLDLSFYNKTNLSYDIEEIKFTIDDKKIFKSTNVQSNTVTTRYRLYNNKNFKKSYRNIYVFKKFTYPDNKVLNVRLTEEQISGRTIELEIKYKDILQADTL